MNNLDTKKQYERYVCGIFLSALNIKGELFNNDIDKVPDVLIKFDGRIIGIEITELKNMEPKIEGRQRELAKSIQSKLFLNFDGSISINIVFPKIKISKIDKKRIEAILISKIEETIKSDNMIKNDYFLNVDIGLGIDVFIHIMKYIKEITESLAKVHVHCVEAGCQNKNPESLIQNTIESKNLKYKEYIKYCDECWLLIFSNPINTEGHFDFSSIKKTNYNSLFKRTFILDLFKPQEIIEIN